MAKSKRSDGEGTVYKNEKLNRWEAKISYQLPDGTTRRQSLSAKKRKDLVAKLKTRRAELAALAQPVEVEHAKMTVSAYLDWWLVDVVAGSVEPTTRDSYEDIVRLYIKPYVGSRLVGELQPQQVTGMLRALDESGKSGNTQRLARSTLRRALRRAVYEGTISRNVAQIADGPRIRSKAGRSLSIEEARSLLDTCSTIEAPRLHRLRAAWPLMLSTGLRRGELLGLRWSDLDLDGDSPSIRVAVALKRVRGVGLVIASPKTVESERKVYFGTQVAALVKQHRKDQLTERLKAGEQWETLPLGHDLVFRTPFGTALDPRNFATMTYALTEAAGLGKWSPHELRHSAASFLLAQGVPLKQVSEMLGHSSIRVTADIYGHLFDDAREGVAASMTEALYGAT